ncbi:hypothetical protein [Parvularcula sp. IMCC14364]|uniref:NUDIX hydrolase n=1 Tax=Parvularcula sp. IMCC14364 TaxID=3067902 RepID=UPI0027403AAA|nr:hypothetical protein [Parvularcula sp. IMCC14364]
MTGKEAPLRPAATILLLRDAPSLQVMMVKRHHQIDFASGALVFPGGKVTKGDSTVPTSRIRRNPEMPHALVHFALGAIRECFEECGILLAYDAISGEMIGAERASSLTPFRPLLDKGKLSLAEFVAEQDLVLAVDRLVHFAHWIGPKMAPKRFDTHFFLASTPERQLAVHDGREAVDSFWIEPRTAMDEQKKGRATIIFPTRCNLEKLGRSKTTKEALTSASGAKVVTVEPWVEERADGAVLCIPPEADYPITAEPIATAMR